MPTNKASGRAARSISWLLHGSRCLVLPFSAGSVHPFFSFMPTDHPFPPVNCTHLQPQCRTQTNAFRLQRAARSNPGYKSLKELEGRSESQPTSMLLFSSPLLSYHIPPVPTPKTSNANSLFQYFQSPRPQSPLLHFIPPPLTFPAMFLPPQHKTPATQEAARTLFEGWRQRIRWLPIPHLDSCSYPLNLLISKTHLPS